MNYQEAKAKALTVKWKTVPCHQGETCWCRMIEPAEKIEFTEKDFTEELTLIGSGSVNTEVAEHIVKLHNASISDYDKEIEARLLSMMKEDPAKLIKYFLLILGRDAVKSNITDFTLSQHMDVDGKRYKVQSANSVEPINS